MQRSKKKPTLGQNVSRRLVTAPAAKSIVTSGQGNREVVVSNRERLEAIGFTANTTQLGEDLCTPCNFGAFVWLAQVASGYDQYMFTKLILEYVPTAATTQAGRVVLAFNYDASETDFEVTQLVNTAVSAEGPCYYPFSLNVPTDNVWRLTNLGANSGAIGEFSSPDLPQRVFGNMLYGTYGSASTAMAGEIYATYVCKLRRQSPPRDLYQWEFWTSGASAFVTRTTSFGPQTVSAVTNGIFFQDSGVFEVIIAMRITAGGGADATLSAVGSQGATIIDDVGFDSNIAAAATGTIVGRISVRAIIQDASLTSTLPVVTLGVGGAGATRVSTVIQVRPLSTTSLTWN